MLPSSIMAAPAKAPQLDLGPAIVRAWTINDKINGYLLDSIDDGIWRADPPGGKGRTVAALFAHINNVRCMWLKAAGAEHVPEKLEPGACTRDETRAALASTGEECRALIEHSLASGGRIKGFKPDVVSFVGYLVAHDSHHRGQISMLARQLGKPISQKAMFGMWEWGKFV